MSLKNFVTSMSHILVTLVLLLTFTFLDIFVLLGPASASNQEEMLGSSEEPLPKGFVLDSGAVLIR